MAPRTRVAPSISDGAVKAKTGKTWPQWFSILDKAGARRMTHREIVAVVSKKPGTGPWWRQTVAVTYELANGLRAQHEKPEGFEITRSKTLPIEVSEVFDAWGNSRKRAQWLPGVKLTIRKATENKTLRITWSDGSNVEVAFHPKGPAKTQVAVQHGRLKNAREGRAQKAFWGDALDRLAQLLAS